MAVDEIQQRKQEQPDNIDEVPVQSEIFNGRNISRREFTSSSAPCKPEQKPNPQNHVKRVHTGHSEVEEEEYLRLLRHVR